MTPAPPDRAVSTKAVRRGFRDDIQGMRALAVLGILVFHAGIAPYPGGFVTLDVFFVLSGFLITTLLLREVAKTGTIDLVGFYVRRARRILPAATVAIVGTVVASWLWLNPLDARRRLRRRRVGGAVRGQHPLRHRGDRLLHRDRPAVAAPALLVAVGGGAVLPRHAARAARVDRGGRPRAAPPRRARPPGGHRHRAGAGDRGQPGVVGARLDRLAGERVLLHLHPRVGVRRRRPARRVRAPPRPRPRPGGAQRRRGRGPRTDRRRHVRRDRGVAVPRLAARCCRSSGPAR